MLRVPMTQRLRRRYLMAIGRQVSRSATYRRPASSIRWLRGSQDDRDLLEVVNRRFKTHREGELRGR